VQPAWPCLTEWPLDVLGVQFGVAGRIRDLARDGKGRVALIEFDK